MEKPSLKSITLRMILSVILIAVFALTVFIAFAFRMLSNRIIKNQAIATSELIKAGLTAHMKAGIMSKRDYFLDEIKTLHEINTINVIRSKEINDQFGPGLNIEQKTDRTIREVFQKKEPVFIIEEFSMNPKIRATIPFIATDEGKLNCMSCHHVSKNTVLGVVDMELDTTYYRNISFVFLTITIIIALILAIMIILNTFRTIKVYIQDPLENLIDRAREAYNSKMPVDVLKYNSIEFENVAKEINLFHADIIKTHTLLEEKNIELIQLNDEIEETLKETVFSMGVIEEQRSKETKNHTRRVSEYCILIAKKLNLPEDEVELISSASPLHDIGKIGISDYILLKSDSLTPDEFEIMKSHTIMGYNMLIHSQRKLLKAAAIIAYQHHEKWDGTGYPSGLSGEDIHLYGRITALADVFDALSTARTYKDRWDDEKVLDELRKERGKHFDPDLVDILFENIDDFIEIRKKYDTE